jgi:type IV pilus assembly protein PilW
MRLRRLQPSRRFPRQRGISLIEMMVGVAIGMLCVLAIAQLLTLWEARKRTVTAGNDAQMSGTLGAYALERELRLAGHGFGTATADVMGCEVAASNSTRSPSDITFNLRAVEIVKGSNDGPDLIRVLYGNSAYFVASQPLLSATAEMKRLKSRDGFQLGDRAVVAGNLPVNCALIEVTGHSVAQADAIEHESGKAYTTLAGAAKSATMNAAGGTGTTFTTGRVFNLGPAPVQAVWTVDTAKRALTRHDRFSEPDTAAKDVASDVVTLKAQYGIDLSGNGQIEEGEWTDTAAATTDWTQLRAVRFALLVRSRHFERPSGDAGAPVPVTPVAPAWARGGQSFVLKNLDGTTDSGSSALTGAAAANNWRNYRYRVYEAVVPLRNMIWGTAP